MPGIVKYLNLTRRGRPATKEFIIYVLFSLSLSLFLFSPSFTPGTNYHCYHCQIEMCKCVRVCTRMHTYVCIYTPTNSNSCQLIFSKATHTQHVQSRIKITPLPDLLLFGIPSQQRHHHPSLSSVHSVTHCWILSILTGLLNPRTSFYLHFICFIGV